MRYLQSFLVFNEGLFTTNESDDQVAQDIINKLSTIDYVVEKTGEAIYALYDMVLDDNPGTYNLLIDMMKTVIEYHKDGKLQFKQDIKCNTSIQYKLFKLIQGKYLEENNI